MKKNAILQFGDPLLRQSSVPITEFGSRLTALLERLGNQLRKTKNGAGLAAPQVGVLKRVSVIDCGNGPIELINPEIIHREGTQTGQEGCLSFSGYWGTVTRAVYVQIRNHDRSGRAYLLDGEGLFARCIAHEIDHLNGILYIDRIVDGILFDDRTESSADLQWALRLSGKVGQYQQGQTSDTPGK